MIQTTIKGRRNKKMECASNKYQNIFKKDQQKIIEHKKNRIHGKSQKELQQRIEQVKERMKNSLKDGKVKRAYP